MVNPTAVNQALRERGVRLTVEVLKDGLWVRGTLPQPDGSRKRQRLSLKLKATKGELNRAESRALQLHDAISSGAYPACGLPWEKALEVAKATTTDEQTTVGGALQRLQAEFWIGRIRTSAAERTWDRITTELKRLPQGAMLTTDLLVAVAATTKAGSRSRLEACKVYKRLGKLAGLVGLEQLDALRTPYEPKQRVLPSDEAVLQLVERVREHERWGWATAALVVYGCRPAEVFSLQPASDGTARVLSIKRKGKLPAWRTALALPPDWVTRLELARVQKPWGCDSPAAYDSVLAKELVEKWGKWLGRQGEGMQLYDVRHAWAVRSIRLGLNASLAAKTMGHSLAVHHSTYHRWLEQSDVAAVAAALSLGS